MKLYERASMLLHDLSQSLGGPFLALETNVLWINGFISMSRSPVAHDLSYANVNHNYEKIYITD